MGREQRPILIIEDDMEIGRLLRSVLEDEGWDVRWHMRGRPGLEEAQQLRPQMVLLDLMLPDTDGRAILRALKADPATASIPIAIVSAWADRLTAEERALVEAVVPKPFDLDDLLGAIERARAARAVEAR